MLHTLILLHFPGSGNIKIALMFLSFGYYLVTLRGLVVFFFFSVAFRVCHQPLRRKRKDLIMNDFRCRFVDRGVGGSVILAEY